LANNHGSDIIDKVVSMLIEPILPYPAGVCRVMPDHVPSEELLESSHSFPGVYQIKVIGIASNEFERRVVAVVVDALAVASDLDYSVRTTPGGRHMSLTLEVNVQSAEQVRSIYARIRELEGVTLLF